MLVTVQPARGSLSLSLSLSPLSTRVISARERGVFVVEVLYTRVTSDRPARTGINARFYSEEVEVWVRVWWMQRRFGVGCNFVVLVRGILFGRLVCKLGVGGEVLIEKL